jgi:tRNA (Thr-GGU) A37 N-methylase
VGVVLGRVAERGLGEGAAGDGCGQGDVVTAATGVGKAVRGDDCGRRTGRAGAPATGGRAGCSCCGGSSLGVTVGGSGTDGQASAPTITAAGSAVAAHALQVARTRRDVRHAAADPCPAPAPQRHDAGMSIRVDPVAHVVGGRADVVDDAWGDIEALLRFDPRFGPEALAGLRDFSHLEVVYVFDRVDPDGVETGARHPRGRADWPLVGIFAQRGKNRPNRLGVSRCVLVGVDGLDVAVRGLDAVDGTPVLDVKPWMQEFAPRGEVRQPGWSTELMRAYW